MKNINLVEILRDCPDETKLYSTLHGEVVFKYITEDYIFPIFVDYSDVDGNTRKTCFTKDGKFLYSANGECVLFPSEEQRDWSKFTAPWYKKDKSVEPKFKAGDKIVNSIRKHMNTLGTQGIISEIIDDKYIFTDGNYIFISNQDSWELFFDKDPKFNPKTLRPFDKVIARIDKYGFWCCELFSFIEEGTNLIKGCGAYYKYCVPITTILNIL